MHAHLNPELIHLIYMASIIYFIYIPHLYTFYMSDIFIATADLAHATVHTHTHSFSHSLHTY